MSWDEHWSSTHWSLASHPQLTKGLEPNDTKFKQQPQPKHCEIRKFTQIINPETL